MRLTYFAPLDHGGIADYAREQVRALAALGHEIDLLCTPRFHEVDTPGVRTHATLRPTPRERPRTRAGKAWVFLRQMVGQHRGLARFVRRHGHRRVLLGSYAEYFAPLWIGPMRRLAREGVVFGAVVHDPVRDAVLGPPAWHRRSIAEAYSFLRHAFVHEDVRLDTVRPAPALTTTVIPHGPYRFETEIPARAVARGRLGLPADAPVLLAFGHIRDNKNLDLTIRALARCQELHLLVAGAELRSGQRTAADYRAIARAAGVETRCHWHVRFIETREIGTFFAAADHVALTYGGGFRSASGVLNTAVQFRLPCLASSGPGPLRTLVRRYELGVYVEPDDPAALEEGLIRLLAAPPRPRWDDYMRDNSWEENARLVAGAFAGADA